MVKKKRWGLLKQRRLPRIVETLAALALLDYTLYLQHVLHHRVPLLWRFHAVHHLDLDLDASTALRFQFGEIALSVPYRIAQVLLIGVDPLSLIMWQTFLLLSIMFHHAPCWSCCPLRQWRPAGNHLRGVGAVPAGEPLGTGAHIHHSSDSLWGPALHAASTWGRSHGPQMGHAVPLVTLLRHWAYAIPLVLLS